jgi:hypothetical protein
MGRYVDIVAIGMSEPSSQTSSDWTAVEGSFRTICDGKGDLSTLGRLIGGICSLGLGGLVEPLLATVNPRVTDWPAQRAAILDAASRIADGKYAWDTHAAVFKANLEALTPTNPALLELEDFWDRQKSNYDLYRAADGNFQIVDRRAPVILAGFMGGLQDHRALIRHWTHQPGKMQINRPVVFDGPGYGWLLTRALETTHHSFLNYSCAVYIVEPDLASICMLLHLQDLRPWASRLRFFVGPMAKEQFTRGLAQNEHWMAPAMTISQPLRPRPSLNLQAVADVAEDSRSKREQALLAEVNAYYDRFTVADWAARYQAALAGGKPLKILGITSRFTTVLQYSMEELGEAVRACGHEFILARETDDQSADRPELKLMAEHKPDLLVLISRMRCENPYLPKNVPFLCWDQDYLPCMRTAETARSLDALTFVAGVGAFAGYQQFNWPRRNCILTGLAASTHRYGNEPVAETLLQKHRCTFSYTSNASGTPQALIAELRIRYAVNPAARSVLDAAAAEVIKQSNAGVVWDALPLAKLVDQLIQSQSATLTLAARQEILADLRSVSDRAFRQVALEWVAQYCREKNATLRLYGKGWESNPQFAEFAAGFLAPGEEMRAVYQATDINLQIIETGFQHSRAFDGLAAGGFFLYRRGAETREFDLAAQSILAMAQQAQATGCLTFGQLDASQDPIIVKGWAYGRDLVQRGKPDEICEMIDRWHPEDVDHEPFPHLNEITFVDQRDFMAMADRYLGDAELRRSVAAKLRKVVVDRFSYDARWREFLKGITSGLQSAAGKAADIAVRRAA